MCFAIPKKIKSVANFLATLEDNQVVTLNTIKAKPNDYILVLGSVVVDKIPKTQAIRIRKTLKSMIN